MITLTQQIELYEKRLEVLEAEKALAEKAGDQSKVMSLSFRIGFLQHDIRFLRVLEGVKA